MKGYALSYRHLALPHRNVLMTNTTTAGNTLITITHFTCISFVMTSTKCESTPLMCNFFFSCERPSVDSLDSRKGALVYGCLF